MTRHGTLAYYLAAWAIGCFVLALDMWLVDSVRDGSMRASNLLFMCFFALLFDAVDVLFFALLLRRFMRWLGYRKPLVWAFAGAALSLAVFALLELLARVTETLPDRFLWGVVDYLEQFILSGPGALVTAGSFAWRWWHVPIEGAVTAAVLCLVDRAFNTAPAGASAALPGEGEAAQHEI